VSDIKLQVKARLPPSETPVGQPAIVVDVAFVQPVKVIPVWPKIVTDMLQSPYGLGPP